MAHNTRSQGSRAPSESGELSQADLEQITKKLQEKEKLIQEQALALKVRQSELDNREAVINREKNAAVGIEGLSTILNSLRQELATLKDLPQQVELLSHRVNDIPVPPIHSEPRGIDSPQRAIPQDDFQRSNSSIPLSSDFASPIRFKDVVDSIPRYDGHKPSVFQFSKICERALKLISPQQEPYLVQMIINKLQGHAYTAVESINFSTVTSLIQHLKKIFGPNKSLNQYRGELGNLYMLPNEDIFNYVERTKDLKTAIVDGETNLYGALFPRDEDRIDQDVLDSFINGLPSDLLVRVKLEGQYGNLDSAIASTIQLSKTLEAESRRRKHAYPIKPNFVPRVDSPARNINSPDSRSEPPPRPPISKSPNVPFIKPLVPGQPGPNSPGIKICKYCKNAGHLISECRKLAYRRSLENVSETPGQMPGNATGVPENRGVHRDANQIGRQTDPKTVRFQQPLTHTPASPN